MNTLLASKILNVESQINRIEEKVDKIIKTMEALGKGSLASVNACRQCFEQIKAVCNTLNENIEEASGVMSLES